jgi:hypothetical protein
MHKPHFTFFVESRVIDTYLRVVVTKKDIKERNEALLKPETLNELKRSHPTVEVRPIALL